MEIKESNGSIEYTITFNKGYLNLKGNVCRLCLCATAEFNIFSDLSIVSKIKAFCELELLENDGLPNHICKDCSKTLNISSHFKSKCIESDKILRNQFKLAGVKITIKDINGEDIDQYSSSIHETETNSDDFQNDNISVKSYSKTNREALIDSKKEPEDQDIYLPPKQHRTDSESELSDHHELLFKQNFVPAAERRPESPPCGLCPCCGKVFSSQFRMMQHLKTHNRTANHTCHICSKVLMSSFSLKTHMRVHSNIRNHSCDVCGKRFKSSSCLKTHMRIVHKRVNAVNCHICYKELSSRKSLKLHIQRHTGEIHFLQKGNSGMKSDEVDQQIMCEDCGKQLKNPTALHIHKKQVHQKFYAVQCQICNKQLSSKNSLKIHLLSHSGEKDFECNICGRKFASKNYLVVHLRVHSGEKPYSCKFCDRKFAIGSTKRAHERLHTGEKPFCCPYCPKKFPQRAQRRGHILNNHKGVESKLH